MPSVAPIPPSLLKMARNNQRKMVQNQREMKQKQRNNLTRKLKKIRNNADNKERVEKAYSKLQARLNALKPSLVKEDYVLVKKSDLKGYNLNKKTKGRSSTLNRIKRMTKKASKAFLK
jgi:hypothetical protein